MKRIGIWICSVVAAALLSVCQAADSVNIATVNFDALPADGDTVTINGVVRTFKPAVTVASTQVAIAANTNAMALAYATQLASYPYTDISVHQQGAMVFLVGKANAALTASKSGSWGSATVTNYPLADYPVKVPFSSYPVAMRATMANYLVDALSIYPSTAIAANATAMNNFLDTSEDQSAGGRKTWTGVQIWNGANQMVGTLKFTNEVPFIDFYDTDASANNRRSQLYLDQSGLLVKFLNDAGTSVSNVFTIARDSTFGATLATFRTALTADQIVNTVVSNSLTTNMIMLHANAAMIGSGMFTGTLVDSNSAPIVSMYETDAAVDKKIYQWRSEAGSLILYQVTDAGAVASNQKLIEVTRNSGALAASSVVAFKSPVQFEAGTTFSASAGEVDVDSTVTASGGLMIGDISTTTMPAGGVGLYLVDGSPPIGDPATGWFQWADSGVPFYRSSAANEGAGQDNHYHNRTGSTFGAGTDYPLTASTAAVDFGTTDPKVTLPTPGTYLVWAELAVTEDGANANDEIRAKLRDESTSTDLSGSDQAISNLPIGKLGTIKMQTTVTVGGGDVVAIWAFNNSSARGTVNSARTRIGYVRLY
jgi:hypothetical protein